MNKSWFYLGAIGSLAIVMTSCGDGNKPATPTASPSPAASSPAANPSPIAAVPATTPVATPATSTATTTPTTTGTPTLPGKKSVSVDVAAGLIAPTNGDNWARTVSKGRSDPFAALALQPIEVTEKNSLDPISGKNPLAPNGKSVKAGSIAKNSSGVKSGLNKSLPTIKVASNPMSGTGKITKGSITNAGINQENKILSSSIPRTGINRSLPKITIAMSAKPTTSYRSGSTTMARAGNNNVLRPVSGNYPNSKTPPKTSGMTDIAARSERVAEKPLQAMAIEISGVIEVDGKTQVIIKLPNESFSRYIDLGDRTANGTVLVKRVEAQDSLSPTIILEEVGVEVSRKVGEKPVATNAQSQSNPK